MDRRERYSNREEELRTAFEALQGRIWTALPGIVKSVNAAKMTISVQPTINARLQATDGTFTTIQMPVLLDCPVLWQGGGGVTAVFPIAAGDECLVVFSSRCIDNWWALGGVQDPPEFRMHNLSDGFALVGVRNATRAYTPPAGVAALMSDDGTTYVQLNPTAHTLKMTAPGGINLNGVTIDSSGNVVSPATVTGQTQVVAGSGGSAVHLTTHQHPTAATGSPSPPTPGT